MKNCMADVCILMLESTSDHLSHVSGYLSVGDPAVRRELFIYNSFLSMACRCRLLQFSFECISC